MNSRGNRRTIPKAAKLEALAVKLETSISIAWQRKTRRRALHGALAATSATVVLVFAHLAALDGSYLDWNLGDLETAVAATSLHALEKEFVRAASAVLVGAAAGLLLKRKRD